MTRCAIYARVSTRDQDAAMQVDELRRIAEHRGWRVVAELVDVGSGARRDLPQRARGLEMARRGEIDVLATWKLDRLARSLRDLLDAAEELRRANVALFVSRDNIDTASPTGTLTFQILGAVAQFERTLIAERIAAGMAKARREGKHVGRKRKLPSTVRAEALLAAGRSVRGAAKELGVSPRTLRRALADERRREVGRNPGPGGGADSPENPTPDEAAPTGGET